VDSIRKPPRAATSRANRSTLGSLTFLKLHASHWSARRPLTKREHKRSNADIDEVDLKRPIFHLTFLPHELIEPGLSNFAGAIVGYINSVIVAGCDAIQSHVEPYQAAAAGGSHDQVQIAAVESKNDLSRCDASVALSGPTFHDPPNPHWFKENVAGGL
jgi:hypothetical protein